MIWEGSMFGRGLASACACKDQLGGLGVDSVLQCAEKKIYYGTGFEQAINAWLIACAGDDLLSQPPFDTINPNVINEFRSRCKRHGFDILPGIADAMVVWIRNYAYTDLYPCEDKDKRRAHPIAAEMRGIPMKINNKI